MAESKITKPETPAPTDVPPAWVVDLLRALKPQGPLEQAGLTPEHIDRITKPPAPQRYRRIPWRSEETGATGIAHVVESRDAKRFPHGRITALENYTHPPEAYIYQAQEGRVPDGFQIWSGAGQRTIPEGQEPQQGDLSPAFLQWRYEEFYRKDLRYFVGRAIAAHHCQEEGPKLGLQTPWLESKVGAVSEA